MNSHTEIVGRAIGERIQELQARVIAERAMRERNARLIAEAAQWDAVPDNISDEMVSLIITRLETDPMAGDVFREEFLEDFKNFLIDLRKNDIVRLARVVGQAVERRDNPSVRPEYPRLELILVPPKEEGSVWHLIAAPLEVTVDYQISLPQSAPCNGALAMEVAPRANDNLVRNFNIPALFLPAGKPAKPLVLAYKPDSDGIKTMLVTGWTEMRDEIRQQIAANQSFRAGAVPAVLGKGQDRPPAFPGPIV